jgi:hypothetical protein
MRPWLDGSRNSQGAGRGVVSVLFPRHDARSSRDQSALRNWVPWLAKNCALAALENSQGADRLCTVEMEHGLSRG